MKKKILLLILLLIPFFVRAADIESVNLKWSEKTSAYVDIKKIDGYDYLFSETEILRINPKKEKDIKKYSIGSYFHYSFEGNKIYVYYYSYDQKKYHFCILDMNLNKLKESIFEMGTPDYYKYENNKYIFLEAYYSQISYVELNDNLEVVNEYHHTSNKNVYYIGKDDTTNTYYFREKICTSSICSYYKYDGNYSEISYSEVPSNLNKETFFEYLRENHYSEGESNVPDNIYNSILTKVEPEYSDTEMNAQIKKDGNNYVVLFQEIKNTWNDNEPYILYGKTLMYLDSNLNEKWRVEYPSITLSGSFCETNGTGSYFSIQKDYIFFSTNESNQQVSKIFDKNGKELLDLSKLLELDFNSVPFYSEFTENGLMLVYGKYKNVCAFTYANKQSKINPTYLNNTLYTTAIPKAESETIIYYLDIDYYVRTKIVEGEGIITTNIEQADEGDIIRFNIEPKPGYVLGEIKVTDANGNVVIFKDYTFTMPSADVTIEATFIPINPNTKTFALYLTVILGGISLIALYLFSQRKKYLK